MEAGLRTYDIYSPYPEEFNRQAVGILSQLNFAPTQKSADNLLREGKDPESIFVTGNTVIDALKTTVREDYTHPELEWARDSRLILLTAHRRENWGEPLRHIFRAIARITEEYPDIKVVYPIHMNPAVRAVAHEVLDGNERVHLIEPLNVIDFHNFMARSFLIMTDSGGIQEEAPSLGEAGTLRLCGTDEETIYRDVKTLLDDPAAYHKMAQAANPYGDGTACDRICEILRERAESGFSRAKKRN